MFKGKRMAQLEYNISTGTLIWLESGKTIYIWRAKSGGFSRHLPRGVYTIGDPNGDKLRTDLKTGFNMKPHLGYFIPLYRAQKRHGFGIHPDGGKPGTHGCIGIQSGARDFFNKFIQYRPRRLIVK